MKRAAAPRFQIVFALLLSFALFLGCAGFASAQDEKKKKKNKKDSQVVDNDSAHPVAPMANEPQIDYMISEMLGAWQVGDLEKLHRAYSEEVTVVNGQWAPPVIGWANYLAAYKQQKARMQQVRMDRTNTYIKVNGTIAWACYQWEFSATVDGEPSGARGQTTLVLEKHETRWLIVHNHTSLVETTKPAGTPAAVPPPDKPAGS